MNAAPRTPLDPVDLVRQAVLAPSSHNTQPWRFVLRADRVELYGDRTRALPVNDPHDRELTMSCGCALLNLRVAAAAADVAVAVRLLPDDADPDWLASVTLHAGEAALPALAELAPEVERRRTYRRRFAARYVEDDIVRRLTAAAEAEQAGLVVLGSEAERQAAAVLVAEGDARQWADASWRRELAAWMHPRRRGDGLPVPAMAHALAQAVVRTFDMGNGIGARDNQLADESPVLAALVTPGDTVADWLRAGQALERVLLTARQAGLQASFLNQPVQVDALRPKLQQLVGATRMPQALLRLGFPTTEPPASPRRPVEDVLE